MTESNWMSLWESYVLICIQLTLTCRSYLKSCNRLVSWLYKDMTVLFYISLFYLTSQMNASVLYTHRIQLNLTYTSLIHRITSIWYKLVILVPFFKKNSFVSLHIQYLIRHGSCVFVVAGTYLPSRCLATVGDTNSNVISKLMRSP
jgi:hypothetical protein